MEFGFRVSGFGFRVRGSELRVWGLGFGVDGSWFEGVGLHRHRRLTPPQQPRPRPLRRLKGACGAHETDKVIQDSQCRANILRILSILGGI